MDRTSWEDSGIIYIPKIENIKEHLIQKQAVFQASVISDTYMFHPLSMLIEQGVFF